MSPDLRLGSETLDDVRGRNVKRGARADTMPDWITPKGFIDFGKFPIESVLRQAMDEDEERFRSACSILETMVGLGRPEAGIFLLGLLSYHRDDIERLSHVVRALRAFHAREAMDALTSELRRVTSSNTTRRYMESVLTVLVGFPEELVRDRLVELSGDQGFSVKWRRKFQSAPWALDRYPASSEDDW